MTVVLSLATAAGAEVAVSLATEFRAVDIVDARSIVPDIALDMRYAGANNFVGERVDGYEAPKCYLHRVVAEALQRVELELRKQGARLKIFDCYRPIAAVKRFVRWAQDTDDQRTKSEYYPNLRKQQLLGEYIAPISGHSRAATLDLTLMECDARGCVDLDMGTPFDFFDARAHTDSETVAPLQRRNRDRLRAALKREGFDNYPAEWWHYTFTPEPTPLVQYDIPIR